MKIMPKTKMQWIRFGILCLITLIIFIVGYVIPFFGYISYEPENGDIIFQPLRRNELVRAIEGVTGSPYSHCGVVLKHNNNWVVIQALGKVKYTPLYFWILQGRYGKFTVYRLKSKYSKTIPNFITELKKFIDMPYDFKYTMDDGELYCSELIYKGFKNATGEEMGQLVTLGDLNWKPYKNFIESIAGEVSPLKRVLITPKHLSEAEQLVKIFSFGL